MHAVQLLCRTEKWNRPGQLVERIETRLSLQHHRRPLHHLFNAVRPADAFAAVQTPPATFYFSSSYSYPAAFSFSSPIDPPPPPPPSLVNRSSRSIGYFLLRCVRVWIFRLFFFLLSLCLFPLRLFRENTRRIILNYY